MLASCVSDQFHHKQMRDNHLSGVTNHLVNVTGDEKRNEDSKECMSFSIDASPLVHHTSAFHKFPIKENSSITCDETRDEVMTSKEIKNRMADFWEKSIQAATQVLIFSNRLQ